MQSLISRHKFGNCDRCPQREVPCVKRKKEMVCLNCAKIEDVEKQTQKAKRRDAARVIGQRLRSETGKGENDLIHSRNNLISTLDFLVSRYVRLSVSNEAGFLNCYTCGKEVFWKDAQCSHFVKRGANLALRFDIRFNCKAACKTCNEYKEGNLEPYAKNLELESKGIVEQLRERGRQVEHITNDELKQMVIQMQAKVNMVSQKIKTNE